MRRSEQTVVPQNKVVLMLILYAVSVLIVISGAIFSVYSVMNNVSFRVINADIPGLVFGILVVYLGIRYFLSLNKLKREVYKDTSVFAWSNYKWQRRKKAAKCR